MSESFENIMGEMSPEEMAQREYRLMLDTKRIGKFKLVAAIEQAIAVEDMETVAELFPHIETVLALFLRDKVTMKVMMKQALRAQVRAECEVKLLKHANALIRQRLSEKLMLLEEYDKDYAALARENEEQRFPNKD